MSRLDYITIAIVAACILAIVFLVYQMTDLFNADGDQEKIENTDGQVELEDDGVYDYETDSADSLAGSTADNETAPGTSGTTTTSDEYDASSSPAADDEEAEEAPVTRRPTASGSKFMVIAGAFTQRNLANKEAARLRRLGYNKAEVEIFDKGKYAVILVDRFDNMAGAERLVKDLKDNGVRSYIKMKERQ